jgi:hypothetical protein
LFFVLDVVDAYIDTERLREGAREEQRRGRKISEKVAQVD